MLKKHKMLLVILLVFVFFSISKDIVLKITIEHGVKALTGLNLKVRSFRVGIFKSAISIKGLKIYNPKDYQEKIMIDIPEIYIDYSPFAMLTGTMHFSEIRIHLKELSVIKNADGQINLNKLKVLQKTNDEKSKPKKESSSRSKKMQIDLLKLKADTASYKDYTKTPPSLQEFKVNIDTEYKDVKDMNSLVKIILQRVLVGTAISNLVNFDIGSLPEAISNTFKNGFNLEGSFPKEGEIKAVEAKVSKALDETEKTSQKAIDDAAKKISSLFGK